MDTNLKPQWSDNKTNLIVIKSKGNSGKTTTLWMLLFELVAQGAKIVSLCHVGNHISFTLPSTIPAKEDRHDFIAELDFCGLQVVLLSHGDLWTVVEAELDAILSKEPDFVVCASRSQKRVSSTWDLFERKYTNIHYNRMCIWSEYAAHSLDELVVKEPTVKAIVKIIKP